MAHQSEKHGRVQISWPHSKLERFITVTDINVLAILLAKLSAKL